MQENIISTETVRVEGYVEAVEVAERVESLKRDVIVEVGDIEFVPVMTDEGSRLGVTIGARTEFFGHDVGEAPYFAHTRPIRQMLYRIGGRNTGNGGTIAPYAGRSAPHVAQEMNPAIAAAHMNEMISRTPDDRYLFRGFDVDVVSMYSDRYQIADPINLLETVGVIANSTQYRTEVYGHIGPYEMKLYVVLPDVNKYIPEQGRDGGSHYAAGFMISTGRSSSHVFAPFIQRTRCRNSIMLLESDSTVRLSHIHAQSLVRHHMIDAVKPLIAGSAQMMKAILESATRELDDFDDLISDVSKKFGLTSELEYALFSSALDQGGRTALGFANGLTQVAQSVSLDTGTEMEALAGYAIQGNRNFNTYVEKVRRQMNDDDSN